MVDITRSDMGFVPAKTEARAPERSIQSQDAIQLRMWAVEQAARFADGFSLIERARNIEAFVTGGEAK